MVELEIVRWSSHVILMRGKCGVDGETQPHGGKIEIGIGIKIGIDQVVVIAGCMVQFFKEGWVMCRKVNPGGIAVQSVENWIDGTRRIRWWKGESRD